MMGSTAFLLIEGVLMVLMHGNSTSTLLEGLILAFVSGAGMLAILCKWQQGFTVFTASGWVVMGLIAIKVTILSKQQ